MKKKKWLYYSLGIIQLIIALGAILAGLRYITEPSGVYSLEFTVWS
jgi:hypothetical protein